MMQEDSGEEEYDDVTGLTNVGRHSSIGHFSRWGPNRPQHTLKHPRLANRRTSIRYYFNYYTAISHVCIQSNATLHIRKCVCHPLPVTCLCIFGVLSLLALVGAMTALSFYAKGNFSPYNTAEVNYGPGDTQRLFFSPLLCEELAVDTLYSSDFQPSTLYLINENPTLSGETDIAFQDEFSLFHTTHERDFHFYKNSVITFEACIDNHTYSGVGGFFLLKGKAIYKNWRDTGKAYPPPSIRSFEVREFCSKGEHDTFNYTVSEEDQYYLIFVNDLHTNPQVATILVRYDIKRTIYQFNKSSVQNSCTSPCRMSVPLQVSTSVLLVYGNPIEWTSDWENEPITVVCSSRVWLYILLSVAGVLVISASIACLCCICCCCGYCLLKERDEEPLLGKHTSTLYKTPSTKEMDDPSRDRLTQDDPSRDNHRRSMLHPHLPYRTSNNPYPPPSYKKAPFTVGSPSYKTFVN